MFIYVYKELMKYNPKLLINKELINIEETKKNNYYCISGISEPSINNNLLQVAIVQVLPYYEELGLSKRDINDIKRIFNKLEKRNTKKC